MPFRGLLYTPMELEELLPYKVWFSSLCLCVKDLPQPMEALQDLYSAIAHHI